MLNPCFHQQPQRLSPSSIGFPAESDYLPQLAFIRHCVLLFLCFLWHAGWIKRVEDTGGQRAGPSATQVRPHSLDHPRTPSAATSVTTIILYRHYHRHNHHHHHTSNNRNSNNNTTQQQQQQRLQQYRHQQQPVQLHSTAYTTPADCLLVIYLVRVTSVELAPASPHSRLNVQHRTATSEGRYRPRHGIVNVLETHS